METDKSSLEHGTTECLWQGCNFKQICCVFTCKIGCTFRRFYAGV